MPRTTQGKCDTCRLKFEWTRRPKLRNAICPRCRNPLARTSCAMRAYPRIDEHPLEKLVIGSRT